jgi:hypothetical protein
MVQAGRAFGLGMSLRSLFTYAALVVSLGGCTTHYIPNTDVEDTEDNRRIIDFCERYRHAVEGRNIPMLLKLADSRYYEDGGNADSSDDMDYDGLREYLEGQFKQTRAIRYEMHYHRVTTGRKQTLFVDYTYSASYKIPSPSGDLWRRRVADNRLEIVPSGESFKILAGM